MLRRRKSKRKIEKLAKKYKPPTLEEKMKLFIENPKMFELMIKEAADEAAKTGYPASEEEVHTAIATSKFGITKIFKEMLRKGINPKTLQVELTNFDHLVGGRVAAERAMREGMLISKEDIKNVDKLLELQRKKLMVLAKVAEDKITSKEAVEQLDRITKEQVKLAEKTEKELEKEIKKEKLEEIPPELEELLTALGLGRYEPKKKEGTDIMYQ